MSLIAFVSVRFHKAERKGRFLGMIRDRQGKNPKGKKKGKEIDTVIS